MKTTLIDIILASWLLILVESFRYSPSEIYISDELPYQPFIPDFKGHTSKGRFYQAIRGNPESPEYPEGLGGSEYHERPKYPDHHKNRPCSIVNQAVDFCIDVMERLEKLKEALKGCKEVETPLGTYCEADDKCYVVIQYFDTTENNMYAAYQRACPCPQKKFSPSLAEVSGTTSRYNLIDCLGQSTTLNRIVLSVEPNSNLCTYIAYLTGESDTEYISEPEECMPNDADPGYVFVCEVSDCPVPVETPGARVKKNAVLLITN